jgi:hypothetical protein
MKKHALLIAILLLLTACTTTISPAHIVCTDDTTGQVIFNAKFDSVTLTDGTITAVTIGADSAQFEAPEGAACTAH